MKGTEKGAFKAFVSGKVQGVWFRKYTQEKARELGLKGYVKNLPDGRVEVHAEGDVQKMEELKKWLYKGSPLSRVDNVEFMETEKRNFENFEIVK